MKRLIATLVVFVGGMVLTSPAAAQEEEAIKAATLEHFVTLSAGDVAAHVQHHLPEHTTFGAEGGLLQVFDDPEEEKRDLQAIYDSGETLDLHLRHLKVNVYGNTAVVTGYLVGTVTSADGETQSVTDRRTAVLIKQGGQWREVHTHSSPLMVPLQ